MKRIFRSLIDIRKEGRPTIDPDELIRNYRSFLTSRVKPEDPSYIKIYTWLEAHYRDHKEMPSIQLLVSRAEKEGPGAQVALAELIGELPFIRSDYKEILKEKFDEQSKFGLQKILEETWQAANDGLKIGKNKEIKGLGSAIEYFISKSRSFRMTDLSIKTESNIKTEDDCKEVLDQYKEKKLNPLKNVGMYMMIDNRIDDSFRGLKPGELMLVAAYVKQGKTITITNLAYNGVMQGLNGLFVTLEMNFQEMRDMFYVMHTTNQEWFDHPKYKGLIGAVTYDKVAYGELSDMEQEFFEKASQDFSTRKDGNLFIYQPTESLTPSRLEMIAYDYNARLKDEGKTLDFLIVDYVGLMVPDRDEKYGDWNIDLNNIIKKLKNMALNFDNGRMLRVISPFQINRTGHKEAEKNDGQYKLSALSNANEAERSSDVIITTYMSDDMKKAGLIKLACLAHRKGAGFDPFEAKIDFGTRQIRQLIQDPKPVNGKTNTISTIPLDL